MIYNKICVVCEKVFQTNHPKIITCSPECSLENRRRKEKEYRDKNRVKKGKQLYHKVCSICGKKFDTYKFCQTICSSECRLEAERRRQAEYERRKREKQIEEERAEKEVQEEFDHRYDWLRKFDPIIKECIKTGMSYGRAVARKER